MNPAPTFLLVAVVAAACQGGNGDRGSSTAVAPSSSPSAKEAPACDEVFEPPKDAEKLCDEHTMGNTGEVHWSSYAMARARSEVEESYRQRASACGIEIKQDASLSLAKGDTQLSIHDAEPASYPSCSKKPSSSSKTVIIVSKMTKR
jgi:hypothetical protein